jgi:predicted RNA-binding Zn-ribbon protein involved in translation (DUF1610 family)
MRELKPLRSCPICRVAMVHSAAGWSCPQCGSSIVDAAAKTDAHKRPDESGAPSAAPSASVLRS